MELLFLAMLALLVFGPRRLPEIARTVAKVMAELRKASNEFRYSLEDEIRNLEIHEQQQKRLEAQAALEAKPTPAVEGTVARIHESNGPA
ncbi:MAG TPA: twin-arginine translocase TatA/TatE family subunit [Terriglobales bacterium]|nr:twin-arginine translocase TatA/TatE family subunit [Terriglobales bacterium]